MSRILPVAFLMRGVWNRDRRLGQDVYDETHDDLDHADNRTVATPATRYVVRRTGCSVTDVGGDSEEEYEDDCGFDRSAHCFSPCSDFLGFELLAISVL